MLAASAALLALSVNAQLKVQSNGKVGIGTTTPNNYYNCTVQQSSNSYHTGALSVRSTDQSHSLHMGQYPANAHVGSTKDVLCFYQWYTSYNQVYAQSYSTASDRNIKDNINSIENGLEMILKMRGVSYNLKEDLERGVDRTVYGFISQEVQEILPELTSEQMDILCLDYQQIIPFLVSGMQEQNKIITDLENEVDELRRLVYNIAESTGYDLSGETTQPAAVLYQNKPNPFKERTIIQYDLPEEFSSASIMVFDMTGEMLETFPISERNGGQLTIEGRQFKPGMYLYSLIVDDVEVDTKKMILSE